MEHSNFVHLHIHSEYSLLDGAIRFKDLMERANIFKMPALALTDHGNMFGALEFYNLARDAGIKPILGCEIYLSPYPISHGNKEKGESNYHLVLLAKNEIGYRNLIKLVSIGYLKGFYYKPRVDKELLKKYSEGLIALSSCLKGEVPSLAISNKMDEAILAAKEYLSIFGKGNFFLELQENGIKEQSIANKKLMEIGKDLSIPLVATNDCHYINKEDVRIQDILICIQTGKTLTDTNRLKFSTDELYFKSPDEMISSFDYCPEAIENTVHIAKICNLDLKFGQFHFPKFNLPNGTSLDEYLESSVKNGLKKREIQLKKRYGKDFSKLKETYEARLKEELEVIKKMGFSGYFLIVADFVNFAKKQGIPVGPGRGSAAGSLVAYCLGITEIDPIPYNLLFERFLNPGRISMPDIDVDFCKNRRDEVLQYVAEKYGKENVAQIISFGTMQARAVIRDVGRVMDIPFGEVDKIAKLIPSGQNITLKGALEKEPRLHELVENDNTIKTLFETASALEGMVRHITTHAAGVVVSNRPLVEYLPLCKSSNGEVLTQYTMKYVEEIGLIKFDFLGLKTLTVIDTVIKQLKEMGIEIDINNLDLDDPETYKLLSSGETTGIFQLESKGMKDLSTKLKPETFEDIIALMALYRPGPIGSGMVDEFVNRKHNKSNIEYDIEELKDILKETYGVILYQEQVMQIARKLANFSPVDADILRKAMGKKNPIEMERQKEKFLEGARKKKIDKKKAEKIFDLMAKFAEYGFNKSHSTAYALISYQTAYLKAHYPLAFMSALMTCDAEDTDKIIRYIAELKEKKIPLLPPDINESFKDFTVSGNAIRFGLAAIKNLGESAIDSIIKAREEKGKFSSLLDFCEKVDLRKVNKRVMESLIKCGAFDFIGAHRSQLMAILDETIEVAQRIQRQKNGPQLGMFETFKEGVKDGINIPLPHLKEWPENQLLKYEREVLGFYLTSHPLIKFEEEIMRYTNSDTKSIVEMKSGDEIKIGGIINDVKVISTKKGDKMAFITIEDMKGFAEVILFPDTFQKYSKYIYGEEPVIVKGMINGEDERLKIKAQEIIPIEKIKERFVEKVHFMLQIPGLNTEYLNKFKDILIKNKGNTPSFVHMILPDKFEAIISLSENFNVSPNEKLIKELENLFGYNIVMFE